MSFSLSGIASGMDTQTIIRQLMELERIPYKKLEQKQSTYNSQLSVFRNINTKLSTLRTAAQDLTLQANFSLRSAVNSDDSVLKATVSDTAAETNYAIEVTQLASRHTLKSMASSEMNLSGNIVISGNGNTLTFTVDEEASTEQNLDRLAEQINGADLGLKASVIETSPGVKTITFTSDKSGYDNQITTGTAVGEQVNIDDGGMLGLSTATAGRDAKLTINGVYIKASGNELKDVIPGLSLSLQSLGTTNITIARDADKIADKVAKFVDAYNDVVRTVRSNSASGAALQGDFTLRSLQDQLYNLFNGRVGPDDGADGLDYRFLYEIGLEIDKGITKGSDMTGTIQFDKDKFKQALADNPEAVYQLFAHKDEDSSRSGIAERFSETLRVWSRAGTGILTARIDGYTEQIDFVARQMESMETRLAMREEQLRKQFVSMEVALSSLNNQMSWLSSQLASLTVNN